MTLVSEPINTDDQLGRPVAAPEPRRATPVKWWAAAGAIAIAMQAYVFLHWIFISGNFNQTERGPDELPGWMQTTVLGFQILMIFFGMLTAYWFFIRKWRRGEKLGIDSYMVIALYLVFWQDPGLNYFQNWATYNAGAVNRGSWASSIPGWLAPGSHNMAAPILFVVPVYGAFAFLCTNMVARVMGRVRASRPDLGNVGVFLVGFAFCAPLVFVTEQAFMRLGIYAYPGAIEWLTLFHNEIYQYPIYEWFVFTSVWTTWASIQFFRNDRGETIAERGLEELRAKTGKGLEWMRMLAVVGVVNVAFFVVYNLPLQPFAMHADEWPDVFLERSYLLNEMCGPGNDRACSGPNTPIPRRGGDFVNTDGELNSNAPDGGVVLDD